MTNQEPAQVGSPSRHTRMSRQDIYDKRISRQLFSGKRQSPSPTVIFLVGQAGAGKSGLRRALDEKLLPQGRPVVIDPDRLRDYNPEYFGNIRRDSRTAASKAEVGDWTQEAFLEAVVRQTNIILDGTGANTTRVKERIAYARAAGYKVEMHAVATRGIDSWLGVLDRHEQGKEGDRANPQGTPGARYVPKSIHDEHARDLLKTLGEVEHLGLSDRITIWRRGAFDTPVYDNTNARQGNSQGAVQALVTERNRPLSVQEQGSRQEAFQRITDFMGRRNATPHEHGEVRSLSVQEHNHGFRRTAARTCSNLKPDVPADVYFKDKQAQRRYAKQARRFVLWHLSERQKQGASPERIAAMGARLFGRLRDPALGFGIKEGLELSVLRQQMAQAPSPQVVQAYFDKRERFIIDVMRARNAHGAGRQRTQDQVQRADARNSWTELEYAQTAALRRKAVNGKLVDTPQPDTEKVLGAARQRTQSRMQQGKKKASKTIAVTRGAKSPRQGMSPKHI